MNETQNNPVASPTPEAEAPQPPETPAEAGPTDELEKWKRLSRENEKRWKQASKELEGVRHAQMTDQERAIEAAKAEARKAALAEVGTSLAEAEIRAQAAAAGVSVPTDYLDLSRFVAEDGRADRERVTELIASLPKPEVQPEFPQLMGTGYHRAGGSDISSMDPNELADFIAGGSFI
ncbi:hypothetical protein LKL35_29445 [Streptomyces sp. ET3-23]|uniref:hypothetical protein n=1 Tax=Streptomyces sp. ET3-23 TaxID=2885643 RepID=UPI001D10564C|nr:hypothetical protein [Streptomyces sp. ET3-23]MCC2279525.1 hypothetical protein [Streptomyces sp. ET3-23]